MFIGHLGVGLGAKRLAPRVSLGWRFFAAEFLDLLWPVFLLRGLAAGSLGVLDRSAPECPRRR